MAGEAITVVVVDDHVLVREGVREILELNDDIVVVGAAASAPEALAEVGRHRPDVVLLDVELPGGDVTETVAGIRKLSDRTQIIILSMYDAPELLRRLIPSGIRGYLVKSVDREELVSAIRSVRADPSRMVLSVSQQSLAQMHAVANGKLSEREREILELVAQALSNSQIAYRTGVSEATVKRHLRNIFVKLEAVSRIDAVNKAKQASLIRP